MTDDYKSVSEFYDYEPAYATRNDVEFFVDQAREAGGPVLEIGCGTGRVLIPTAQAGIEIHGLDASKTMLSKCREKLAAESPEVRSRAHLHTGDMRTFHLGKKFKLVTVPFRPFQHLITVEDQLACLATIQQHLEPDGKLILDLFNPSLKFLADESILGQERGDQPEFILPDGRSVKRRDCIAKRDLLKQVQDIELIHYVTHPDGRTERLVDAFPMRYFFRYEVEHLLVRAGFAVESVFADYEKRPYGSTYPGELIFVAKKI